MLNRGSYMLRKLMKSSHKSKTEFDLEKLRLNDAVTNLSRHKIITKEMCESVQKSFDTLYNMPSIPYSEKEESLVKAYVSICAKMRMLFERHTDKKDTSYLNLQTLRQTIFEKLRDNIIKQLNTEITNLRHAVQEDVSKKSINDMIESCERVLKAANQMEVYHEIFPLNDSERLQFIKTLKSAQAEIAIAEVSVKPMATNNNIKIDALDDAFQKIEVIIHYEETNISSDPSKTIGDIFEMKDTNEDQKMEAIIDEMARKVLDFLNRKIEEKMPSTLTKSMLAADEKVVLEEFYKPSYMILAKEIANKSGRYVPALNGLTETYKQFMIMHSFILKPPQQSDFLVDVQEKMAGLMKVMDKLPDGSLDKKALKELSAIWENAEKVFVKQFSKGPQVQPVSPAHTQK